MFINIRRIIKPLIFFVAILCVIVLAAIWFKIAYTDHMEEKIMAKPLIYSNENRNVSIQDYATTYDAISGATGNYITGVAAFLTLLLLAFQYHEIREAQKRYLEDKKRAKIESEKNDIHRIIDIIDEKVDNLAFGTEGKRGVRAINKVAENLQSTIEFYRSHSSDEAKIKGSDQRYKYEGFSEELGQIITLAKFLFEMAETFEPESKNYMKNLYLEMCEYKFQHCLNQMWRWLGEGQIPFPTMSQIEIRNRLSRYFSKKNATIGFGEWLTKQPSS